MEPQKRFILKVAMLGEKSSEKKEVKFLNRLIRWTSRGLEIEGDPHHAQTLLEEWNLEQCRLVERHPE